MSAGLLELAATIIVWCSFTLPLVMLARGTVCNEAFWLRLRLGIGSSVGGAVADGDGDDGGSVLVCGRGDQEGAVGAAAAEDDVGIGNDGRVGGGGGDDEIARRGFDVGDVEQHRRSGRVFRRGDIGDG